MADKKTNIVFIMADDLGYGDLSCYGATQITTPNLDKLADEGMRFTDAHSPSAVCTPTRYGVLTGRYCWRTELKKGVLFGYSPPLISKGETTVASLLKNAGYRTAAIGKWHLGLGWAQHGENVDFTERIQGGPLELGFDYFFGIPASLDMAPYTYIENDRTVGIPSVEKTPLNRSQREGLMVPGWEDDRVNMTLTEKAVEQIKDAASHPEQPFFLYMALTGPHTPWNPADFVKGKSSVGLRGDMILELDWTVGQITQALEQHGLKDDTLVIFTSDNGPDSREIDELAEYGHNNTANLRGIKADIWDGGHRVPYIAAWPGRIPPGTVSDEIIELTDLMATCASIGEIDLPDEAAPDSYDILPALLGESSPAPIREAAIHHSVDGMFSIRQGKWKLVEGLGSGGFSVPRRIEPTPGGPQGQLYNLEDDLYETNNLYQDYPEIVRDLSLLLERYVEQGHSRPRKHGSGHNE